MHRHLFRFTTILGNKKFKPFTEEAQTSSSKIRSSARLSTETSSTIVYGEECQFCGKNRVQHGGKKVLPVTIVTRMAENSIKSIARDTHPDLYGRIEHKDLIPQSLL
jgi:hypothetical protein